MATTEHIPAEVFPPGDFLKEELDARGWSQTDFAQILGKTTKTVNEIVLGKRRITPETARLLGQALGTSARVWVNLESAYQLYTAERNSPMTDAVSRKALIYGTFPIREMQKRGWIDKTDNVDVLEAQLDSFYASKFRYAARKHEDDSKAPLQLAWLHRTYNLAKRMQVENYTKTKLHKAFDELKSLLGAEEEIRHVSKILGRAGVRFLAVEALPTSKIDGVCFWLNSKSPVIAVSLRYDRIDHFWFTLLHELHHVKYGHGKKEAILDTDLMINSDVSTEERQANEGAVRFLIPPEEMEDFINCTQPSFNTNKIKAFAEYNGVHMGIVVGHLQHRKLIAYSRNRKTLVKVRYIVTQSSTYDGWGMGA